ncbi:Mysoin-binding motif of peroxisomes-domain-containing protein [Coniella lustricola]|uniref:Vezatin n=1 Tax=Coniella lustricola TaxID=2025994 RepID=A0A2T3AHA4_9PEZI|nr:Mysoin-binding motif of peroxisomes-domain-containing protein [Coniella lustricola]
MRPLELTSLLTTIDEGEEQQRDWAIQEPDVVIDTPPPSPPTPSTSFAPTGRPLVKTRFRNKIPDSLNLNLAKSPLTSASTHKRRLSSLQHGATKMATELDRADNSRFIEQFRYTIVASQLLSGHSMPGQRASMMQSPAMKADSEQDPNEPSQKGLVITAMGAISLAWFMRWLFGGGLANLTKKRVIVFVVGFALAGIASQAYLRQQWLRYVRQQVLAETSTFVSKAQDFDSASTAALALIQEVELVSRGYRLSAPLPPISRIEDRSQTRRCVRLRKALSKSLETIILKYEQASSMIKGLSEPLDLERYYDIYDINDLDMSDALQGYTKREFEDMESLKTLKAAASRFHIMRKMYLCAMMSIEAQGDETDFARWTTVLESLRILNDTATECYAQLNSILSEEDSFQAPTLTIDKDPLSPGRERWRSQLRKLNSLTTGIRGLQAKMTLLREESDRSLNEASDISELGPSLMEQYESIGQDLKMLQQAWEDGKAALASGIDRNEKRLSSVSIVISPSSLSGLATVEEKSGGGVEDALRALTGGPPADRLEATSNPGDGEEVFEAVAMPLRPRSTMTREERIMKMREDRERRADMKEKADASRGMLKELEMVINLRPNKTNNRRQTMPPINPRVVSM